MIKQQIELTEEQLYKQICQVPNSLLKVGLSECTSLTGIVTYIKLHNGKYYILSRYEEDKWTFPASKGTRATQQSNLTLDFSTIRDVQLRGMAKWIMWNRIQEGLAIGTLINLLYQLKIYFKWVTNTLTTNSARLNAITSSAYLIFVNNQTIRRKGELKHLSPGIKIKRFSALEDIYRYCKDFEFVAEHPWMESSAGEQAGWVGQAKIDSIRKGRTLIIPDEVLIPLCKLAKSYLDQADILLTLKEKIEKFSTSKKNASSQSIDKFRYLQSMTNEFDRLDSFNEALLLLRDSCIFWILLTTGMRIHEVLGIKRGGYRTERRGDIAYYYITTVSKKTHTGLAEWIAPQIAVTAIEILSRYSEPFQRKLQQDLAIAQLNSEHAEAHRLEHLSGLICLSQNSKANNSINVLSGETITANRLQNMCKLINKDWNLTTHQFRRTFANYVVHSELGDLRALKDHFKHWSIRMTVLYAYNDELDSELFEELLSEKHLHEEEIKHSWFNLDTPISGGKLANRIKKIRANQELIKTFGSHREMVMAYSSSIPIRSTGIGWCTNDYECKCDKPDICDFGIIDNNYLPYWEEYYYDKSNYLS